MWAAAAAAAELLVSSHLWLIPPLLLAVVFLFWYLQLLNCPLTPTLLSCLTTADMFS